jgi:ligand-binding sensor domain-containing protein
MGESRSSQEDDNGDPRDSCVGGRSGKQRVPLGLLAIATAVLASAAFADQAPRFVRLTVEDGLSQNSVGDIVQDRLGFLWFGTQEGLNRYDGYRFVVHRARDEPGFLRDHNITALIEDRRGDLWVGTSRGLHRLDLATGRFHREAEAATPHRRARCESGR